ncbi:uncharacterized protein LOC144581996 isoform X2 [Callithrix jacchus]
MFPVSEHLLGVPSRRRSWVSLVAYTQSVGCRSRLGSESTLRRATPSKKATKKTNGFYYLGLIKLAEQRAHLCRVPVLPKTRRQDRPRDQLNGISTELRAQSRPREARPPRQENQGAQVPAGARGARRGLLSLRSTCSSGVAAPAVLKTASPEIPAGKTRPGSLLSFSAT